MIIGINLKRSRKKVLRNLLYLCCPIMSFPTIPFININSPLHQDLMGNPTQSFPISYSAENDMYRAHSQLWFILSCLLKHPVFLSSGKLPPLNSLSSEYLHYFTTTSFSRPPFLPAPEDVSLAAHPTFSFKKLLMQTTMGKESRKIRTATMKKAHNNKTSVLN